MSLKSRHPLNRNPGNMIESNAEGELYTFFWVQDYIFSALVIRQKHVNRIKVIFIETEQKLQKIKIMKKNSGTLCPRRGFCRFFAYIFQNFLEKVP